MKFFESCRPEVYIHGAKLRRDKKTGKRMWGLTLIVTLSPELASKCHSMIRRAAEYVATLENATVDLLLSAVVESCTIDFFSAIDDAVPVVHLQGIDLGNLRLTRDGNIVEFWFQGEKENSAGLHAFVKEYAFTRVWAAFTLGQRELAMPQKDAESKAADLANDPKFVKAIDRLASSVGRGGVDSISISTPGMDPVVIDKAAAENIHRRAKRVT